MQLTVRTGRLNVFAIYRPPRSPRLFRLLQNLSHCQPIYLSELVVDHIPTRSLRSSDKVLLVLRTKTVTASRAFHVVDPKTWNSLPLEIRSTTSARIFHQLLKHICSTVHITNWSPNGASVVVPQRLLDTRKCTDLWRWLTTNFDFIVLYCVLNCRQNPLFSSCCKLYIYIYIYIYINIEMQMPQNFNRSRLNFLKLKTVLFKYC